jgi:hypothetical protein
VAATSVPVSAPKTTAPAPTPAPALPLPARHDWHRGDRDGRSHGGPCAPRGRHDR